MTDDNNTQPQNTSPQQPQQQTQPQTSSQEPQPQTTQPQAPQAQPASQPAAQQPQQAPQPADPFENTSVSGSRQSGLHQQPQNHDSHNSRNPQDGWPQQPQQNGQSPLPDYEPNRTPGAQFAEFSVGMKIVWIALGFFLDIFSLPLPFLLYGGTNKRLRNSALRYCVIGLILSMVVYALFITYGDPSLLNTTMPFGSSSTGTGSSSGSTGSAF